MNASSASISEKLGQYLGTLAEPLLIRLVHEIRGAALLGEHNPANAMIADAVDSVLVARHPHHADVLSPDMALFHPVIPFLVPTSGNTKYPGRIRRKSIEGLWVYLSRDQVLDDLNGLARNAALNVLNSEDKAHASSEVEIRNALLPELFRLQQNTGKDNPDRARLIGQLGGKAVAEDIGDITRVMNLQDVLAKLSRRLPSEIEVMEREHLTAFAAVVSALQPADYALPAILLNNRMTHPAAILRILIDEEKTDDAALLAKSPFAVLFDVLIDELALLTDQVAEETNSRTPNDQIIPCLRRFHNIAAGLTTEISIEMHGAWFQQLAQARRRMADVAAREIEQIPGRLRLAIQPGGGSLVPDLGDIEVAVNAARLLVAVKPLRSELALNETVSRVNAQAESLVDAAARSLPQQARAAGNGELLVLNAQFTGLSCVAKQLFGNEYAQLLTRSGQVAGLQRQSDLVPQAA
jgi:hypothetical protein